MFALALLKRFWPAIPIILLTIALLATRGTLADTKRERDLATIKLSVSNASIDRLQTALRRVTVQQMDLAADDAARVQASRQAAQLAEAAAKVRQAAIDRLMASAGTIAPGKECEPSDTVQELWK